MKSYKSLKEIEIDLQIAKIERELALKRIILSKKILTQEWNALTVFSSFLQLFFRK